MSPVSNSQSGFSVVGGQRETLASSLAELWRFRPLILELVRRDLKVRYKNRVGGVLWSLFPPLMQVLTITLLVKYILSPVDNYSAYLMPVMFLWQFFQNTVVDASQSLLTNSDLARKIYFPRAILPLVALISNFIHFLVSLGFTICYYFAVHSIYPANIQPSLVLILPIILGVGILGLGLGYLLAYMATIYDDIKFLSVTLLGLFFYALPILYPIEKVAAHPKVYDFYMLNPLASWLIGFQRALLLPPKGTTVFMPYEFLAIATVSSLTILVLGFWIFERSKWAMMERL